MLNLDFPPEYSPFLLRIPEKELEIFQELMKREKMFSFETRKNFITLLEQFLKTVDSPSRYWYYIFGRSCVNGSQYALIERMYHEKGEPLEFRPFLARAWAYQHRHDAARALCTSFLASLNETRQLELLGLFLVLEARFALGIVHVYTRAINDLEQEIAKIKELASDLHTEELLASARIPSTMVKLYYLMLEATLGLYTGKPGLLRDVLLDIQKWVDEISDPWWKGYYYNMLGIYYMQGQRLAEGITALKNSYKHYQLANDLRGASAVAGNIGTALILSGDVESGRIFLKDASKDLIRLKNYYNAIGHTLSVSKSYLDEKNYEEARNLLNVAEKLRRQHALEIQDPAFAAMFCYLHSRLKNFSSAEKYLEVLKKLHSDRGIEDFYTSIWYYFAESVLQLAKNNLSMAEQFLKNGLSIVAKNRQHDFGLELSQLLLEVHLKRFLLDGKDHHLYGALRILLDLEAALKDTNFPYFKALVLLMLGYLNLALESFDNVVTYLKALKKMKNTLEMKNLLDEVTWFENRVEFYDRKTDHETISNPWLSNSKFHDTLKPLLVLEIMRLISRLQFQQLNIGAGQKRGKHPKLLLIVDKNRSKLLFSHVFGDEDLFMEKDLIGGLLSALSRLSSELFGLDLLRRIEQEDFEIIVDHLDANLIMALVVDEDNYDVRMRLRKIADVIRTSYLRMLTADEGHEETALQNQQEKLHEEIDITFGE